MLRSTRNSDTAPISGPIDFQRYVLFSAIKGDIQSVGG